MIDEQVRPATGADAPALAELEATARQALVEQRGGPQLLAEQPAIRDWAALIDAPEAAVYIGSLDGVAVAYLEIGYVGEPDGGGEVVAVVRQAYVDPEARELGLGDGMLEIALVAARARGCTAVEGTALPGDRNTKNLYERAGITARKITVWKRLTP